jgi:hypothetical protein
MRLAQRQDGRAKRVEVVRMRPLTDDEDVVQRTCGPDLDVSEVATHPGCDVSDGGLEGATAGSQRVAVDVPVLARRTVRLVLVDQLVAAGRLTNCAVLQGFNACREPERARGGDEGQPEHDRAPRTAHAPAGNPRDGTHDPSLRPLNRGANCHADERDHRTAQRDIAE